MGFYFQGSTVCFNAKVTKQMVKTCSVAPYLPSLAACSERKDGDEKKLNKPSCKVINPTASQCEEISELLQKKVGFTFFSILTN